ncbi:MAG: DUF4350 domain-containing protein [Bacteroidales bacterium]|nr:DUF4350 domain-containing protein [Bacteroidales bacterium]
MKTKLLFICFLVFKSGIFAQQIADTSYRPKIIHPAYQQGAGPIVFIDEGHHNFHTKEGRYWTFANLLERDGYIVKPFISEFDKKKLSGGKILVISNAQNEINLEHWYLPTPSAFTDIEIEELKDWVGEGGSLFLIADHMPFAGAAEQLASSFGFEFTNGFVADTNSPGPAFFSLDKGSVVQSTITLGRDSTEEVRNVVSFTGQGFNIPEKAIPILLFNDHFVNLLPDTAWVFDSNTKIYNAKGLSQGAYLKFGKGRVVVFGEAAMFSAQLAGPNHVMVGMNSDYASENYQLLLNIIHWLDGKLD